MTNKNSLSVTLATYNEAANLSRCLNSVKSLADEIIIVDGTSTDDTVKIARQYTNKITVTTNPANFHLNKKKANDQAKSAWVLQLDADESLTPELQKEIKMLLDGKYYGYNSWQSPLKSKIHQIIPLIFTPPQPLTEAASAYYLPRQNFFLGRYLKHTAQYPDPVIRLFQKDKAYLPAKDVHEQMVVNGTIGWLKGDLDHYATPEFSRYLLRENRYSSLLAHQLYNQSIKINFASFIKYFIYLPTKTFLLLFLRYQGFQDGFPGFVFSLFSGIHFQLAFMKLWEIYKNKKHES